MSATIRRAQRSEATALTEIAHQAKRYWGYPEKWIQLWKDVLTITSEFIGNHEVFVVQAGGEIAGLEYDAGRMLRLDGNQNSKGA